MKILLSLPPNLVTYFREVEQLDNSDYFYTSDPVGHKLGSGGGTYWLLKSCYESENTQKGFLQWLSEEKRILLHAGGQSRRLPSYAPMGKVLLPVPFSIDGRKDKANLLQTQMPVYERIMRKAPARLHTLVASGDVCVKGDELQEIPDVDVVCYGLPVSPSLATNHGVFFSQRDSQGLLDFMLQKPSVETIRQLSSTHIVLMDIGIWLLSDRAVELLMKRSELQGVPSFYDLYGEFGCALGKHPTHGDKELGELSVAILPLKNGEFHHFGTSREMIDSSVVLSGKDSSVFIQNAHVPSSFSLPSRSSIWIENSWIGSGWTLTCNNIVTGVPQNNWNITLEDGVCVDVQPVGEKGYVLRPYGIDDKFRGSIKDDSTLFLNRPITQWLKERQLEITSNEGNDDIHAYALFPVSESVEEMEQLLHWMLTGDGNGGSIYKKAKKLSADDICNQANIVRLQKQRMRLCNERLVQEIKTCREDLFGTQQSSLQSMPKMNVEEGQYVKSTCPVRIDLAGGWTDTPPFCFTHGGNVVNMAVELNGKPSLQVTVHCIKEFKIVLHSVDFNATEILTNFDELRTFTKIGNPFSIPKAALALSGFIPQFCSNKYHSLVEQLKDFGCGIEITLFSDLPAGSGMGTSSILASTVLGALNDFCALGWSREDICSYTLLLEHLLTTGGGWQDQYGGVWHGLKLLQTKPGIPQSPQPTWLPDTIFTSPETSSCHLLYYTGLTRTAKKILAEIVHNMNEFDPRTINLLVEMKRHASCLSQAISNNDFDNYGRLIYKTWNQNKSLDAETNPPEVEAIISRIHDFCLGYKLPGAGGGGFLYMVAKDHEAARRIRQTLTANPPNEQARFFDMAISSHGLLVRRDYTSDGLSPEIT